MNGHFSAVGDTAEEANYEHGVQIIDEDKEYKYVLVPTPAIPRPCRPFPLFGFC
jgi:hypothetical protein